MEAGGSQELGAPRGAEKGVVGKGGREGLPCSLMSISPCSVRTYPPGCDHLHKPPDITASSQNVFYFLDSLATYNVWILS